MKVELKNVTKSFLGRKVLDDVSFTVESQDFSVLLGPANAGKSTILKIIAGVLQPESGQVLFDDKDVTKVSPQKRNCGVIFQNYALYPNYTAYDNIASPLTTKHLSKEEIDKRVREQAKVVRIDHLLDKHPNELSGGESQRLALARALVRDADIYLLDEPITGLDYKLRESMRIEMKKLMRAKNATILMATPSPEEALALGRTVVFLYRGRVVQTGNIKECYAVPSNILSAQICSAPPMNLVPSNIVERNGGNYLNVADNKFEVDVSHLNLPKEEKEILLGLFPYNIYLNPKTAKSIAVDSDLIISEPAGSEMSVRIRWNKEDVAMYLPFLKILEEKLKVYVDPLDMYLYSQQSGKLITKYRAVGGA